MWAVRRSITTCQPTQLDSKYAFGVADDELRANSKLKSSEYSVPVLGLIFLRYADHKFAKAQPKFPSQGSGRRSIGKADYQARGVLYLEENARVVWRVCGDPWKLEEGLITTVDLPLNLDQNARNTLFPVLTELRRAAKVRARSLAILPR